MSQETINAWIERQLAFYRAYPLCPTCGVRLCPRSARQGGHEWEELACRLCNYARRLTRAEAARYSRSHYPSSSERIRRQAADLLTARLRQEALDFSPESLAVELERSPTRTDVTTYICFVRPYVKGISLCWACSARLRQEGNEVKYVGRSDRTCELCQGEVSGQRPVQLELW